MACELSENVPTELGCAVCASPRHRLARLCKRCKRLVDRVDIRRKADREARIRALFDAWRDGGFHCHYTGIQLDESDRTAPRYLTFDHRTPRQENDVVVAAAVINDMKSDLAEDEFWAVVRELATKRAGGHFDARVLDLRRWKR